jgi:rhamnogalacturonyl hydrolase YesR
MTTFEEFDKSIDRLIETTDGIIKKLREQNKKQKEALDYVKQWLNETIDEGSSDTIEEDSANLLHNMKLILEE